MEELNRIIRGRKKKSQNISSSKGNIKGEDIHVTMKKKLIEKKLSKTMK